MSDVIGRAGFHAVHTKPVSDRRAILHEMMRELDADAIEYWAQRNPNIVVADEQHNEAFVNDGRGGFKTCTSWDEVEEYGNERLGRLSRALRKDKYSEKNKRMQGGTFTTSLLVAHLPKSMCKEIPDYYPRINPETGQQAIDEDGEPMWRSRWVARDRDEARRYFEHVVEYLTEHVVSGGQEALLGYDIQHSESTPHIQLMFDAFEDDPKKPGKLRATAARDWFEHRDVVDEKGRIKSGKRKLREYHADLKKFLIGKGYEISPDFDEERHLEGLPKALYEELQDQRKVNETELARAEKRHVAAKTREVTVSARERSVKTKEKQLKKEQEVLELERRSYKAKIDAEKDAEVQELQNQLQEKLEPYNAVVKALQGYQHLMTQREKDAIEQKKQEAKAAFSRAQALFGGPDQQKPTPGQDFQMGG